MSVTGPNLLPVDYPLVADQFGACLQARQIGAGVRLRKTLNPDLISRENLRQVSLLLFIAAMSNDRRADQAARHIVESPGRAGTRGFLRENELLDDRRSFPAILFRPRQSGIPSFVQSPIPLALRRNPLNLVFLIRFSGRHEKASIGQ